MSSSASVVPNVNYHLPKPLAGNYNHIDTNQTNGGLSGFEFKRNLTENSSRIVSRDSLADNKSLNKSAVEISGSKLMSCSLDSAIRNSLKSVPSVPLNSLCPTEDSGKILQRTLTFHESSSPNLDSVIKHRIQTLPRSLILTNSNDRVSSNNNIDKNSRSLCSDDELDRWCRSGPQNVPHKALGFGNSGNTCYLNSVLQCILATGPLLAYINAKHSSPSQCAVNTGQPNLPYINKTRFCGLCGLHRLITEHSQRAQNGTCRPDLYACGHTVPSYFVANVRAVCPSLRPYQQEDAHEFLLGLLSRMEDSSMAAFGKVSRRVAETNVIRRIFGGTMRSEVTCRSCHKVSARDEQWFNLSMDITGARSLQQCLCNYIRSEELHGQNAYKCENCRQLRPAIRRCTVFHAPPILIIQFNRFSRNQKLDMRVEFPSSFNLRPFMTQSKGPPVMYRLYATVNHEGFSCRSGHYVSFTCRHGQWLSHNDSFVSSTNADHVLRQAPYLLFYEAVQPTIKQNVTPNSFSQSRESIQSPSSKESALSTQNSHTPTVGTAPNPNKLSNSQTPASLLPHPVLVNQIRKPIPSLGPSVPVSKTPTTSLWPTGNTNDTVSVPRVVFNPNFTTNHPSISDTSSKTSSDGTVIINNGKPVETLAKLPASSSIDRSTPNGNKSTPNLSTPTVRQLLFGTESTPGLWTERSLSSNPSNHADPSAVTTATNNSKPGINTDSVGDKVTAKNSSDQVHVTNLDMKTTVADEELKDPLVDYTSETSDSETEYVSPAKRARTSDSSSDSSVVWVPASNNISSNITAKATSPVVNPDNWKRRKRHKSKKKKKKSKYHNHSHSLSSNDSYSRNREHQPRHRNRHHDRDHKYAKHRHDSFYKKHRH